MGNGFDFIHSEVNFTLSINLVVGRRSGRSSDIDRRNPVHPALSHGGRQPSAVSLLDSINENSQNYVPPLALHGKLLCSEPPT